MRSRGLFLDPYSEICGMDPQAARDLPGHSSHGIGHYFGNGVKGNVRFQSSSVGRGIKTEAVDEQKVGLYIPKAEPPQDSSDGLEAMSTSTQQTNHIKARQHQGFPPIEPDVCAWLRDEPDVPGSGFLQSASGTAVGRNSAGSGGHDCSTETGGSPGVADGAGSTLESTEEASAQRKAKTAQLYAQLRGTKIKESVLLEGIQTLGGGQKGLRGVVKAILFWLEAKNRHNNSPSIESCLVNSELSSPRIDEMDQFSWSNLDFGSVVDAQVGHSGDLNNASPTESFGLVNSPVSLPDNEDSLCDLRPGDGGSGEYGQVANYGSEPHISLRGFESVGGLPGRPRSQGSGPAFNDLTSVDWVPPMREYSTLRQEKSHRAKLIRKHSPSPDRSGVHCAHELHAFDDALPQRSKIRLHSPAGYTSSQSSNEFPAYLNTAPSELLGTHGIFGGVNPFGPGGPFNLTLSSPPHTDPPSMDFSAFGTQCPILIDENMGLGSSVHGCGLLGKLGSVDFPLSPEITSVDRKSAGPRLGVVGPKSKASPAACTRLARKQRMDRNRKAALYQVNRSTFDTGALLGGKSGGISTPGSLRKNCLSQGSLASEAPTCRTIDRRDQENLQFLLLKVLRPSDVGNLGRIVLPKKDAESHLPWLGAREGIAFACEDYDTGEMMTLRYRFWPNNKSRMYLLENTGEFVKKHHLQESDRMLIYRSQPRGTYIIRARKAQDCVDVEAQDCVDSLPNLGHREDMDGIGEEISDQNSPGGPCSSGTSSLSGAESMLGSGHDGVAESRVPVSAIITSQDDLLNFADLPDAPMGECTDHLVRFPSLESFDVELLELAPVTANREDATSCRVKMKEEQ